MSAAPRAGDPNQKGCDLLGPTTLVDPYNRHLNYLRVYITDRCNLRCVYSVPPGGIPKH